MIILHSVLGFSAYCTYHSCILYLFFPAYSTCLHSELVIPAYGILACILYLGFLHIVLAIPAFCNSYSCIFYLPAFCTWVSCILYLFCFSCPFLHSVLIFPAYVVLAIVIPSFCNCYSYTHNRYIDGILAILNCNEREFK